METVKTVHWSPLLITGLKPGVNLKIEGLTPSVPIG